MKSILLLLFTTLMYATAPTTLASDDTISLNWIDLVPEQERNRFNSQAKAAIAHSGIKMKQSKAGGVRSELNGKMVKIPGFVIPLEGDEKVVTEFLLVPYLGACIHVPPPPPNQIIYVKFPNGAPSNDLWDIVNLVGTLKTETLDHELAQIAYVIEGKSIIEYNENTQ